MCSICFGITPIDNVEIVKRNLKLKFANPYFLFQKFTSSGFKDLWFGKFDFVAKTQFLYNFSSQRF